MSQQKYQRKSTQKISFEEEEKTFPGSKLLNDWAAISAYPSNPRSKSVNATDFKSGLKMDFSFAIF